MTRHRRADQQAETARPHQREETTHEDAVDDACRSGWRVSCDIRGRAEEVRAGVTDTEIKIGNIMPYSGPASAYGMIGQTETASSR